MSSYHSFPKVWAIGHAGVSELFYEPVLVEEKVDGSQFSFGVVDGELKARSKGQEINLEAPDNMFSKAVDFIKSIKDLLTPEWTYRAEYLQKPKHNVLTYARTPVNNLILFDINNKEEGYLTRLEKETEAKRLGLEVVPVLFEGKITSAVELEAMLNTESVLGRVKIEGFVVKNYLRFGRDKKVLMGKFVSESFKEQHKVDWKASNPTGIDIVQILISQFRAEARWDKSIQHLRERGELVGTVQDIGKICREVPKDLIEECEDEIKKQLFEWAQDKIRRGVTRGLAEYYKEKLFKAQFEDKAS